jgi:DNA adenine methylase
MVPLLLEISSAKLTIKFGHRTVKEKELAPPRVRPFVKWPGGKQWLSHAAPSLIPTNWSAGRYYEPFAGGAAFFFSLMPARATLSDRNSELMTTYRVVRSDSHAVIRLLARYPHNEKFYYAIRDKSPRAPTALAARFVYLNRTCWNGLYRVNREGRFNTPYGRFPNPTICDRHRLQAAASLLRRARLRDGDFADIVQHAERGDLVYFDPPYITGHQNNGFLKYNAPLFSWEDQRRLARIAKQLAHRGVHVLISNADHSTVASLYPTFHLYRLHRKSLIAGPAQSRGSVSEVLISSYPILNERSIVV